MNKHVNKVQKATGRAEAITAGRQQNKQYLIKKTTTIRFKQSHFRHTIKLTKHTNIRKYPCF